MKAALLTAFRCFLVMASISAGRPLPADERMCKVNKSAMGQTQVTCYFPSCNSGEDCMPPNIQVESAKIELEDAAIRMLDAEKCKKEFVSASCWEVWVRTKVKLTASDPSGVKAIGAYLTLNVDGKLTHRKLWSNDNDSQAAPTFFANTDPPSGPPDPGPTGAPAPPGSGDEARPTPPPPVTGPVTIEMFKWVTAHVPVGQRLEIQVTDLCASDGKDNRGCVPSGKDTAMTMVEAVTK